MKYLILGDVHGNFRAMADWILSVQERDIDFDEVIQVGDFGMFNNRSMNIIKDLYNNGFLKHKIHFIDGNHEDHGFILWKARHELKKYNIHYHLRSTITNLPDGTNIGWLGGAFNVEQQQYNFVNRELCQVIYNYPNKQDLKLSFDNFNKLGKPLDLMVTHSCPCGIGIGIKGHPMFTSTIQEYIVSLGFPEPSLYDCGDTTLTDLYHGLDHKPVNWVFGHLHGHHYAKVGTTNFYCVGCCDGSRPMPRIYIYDSELKQVLT